jgi:hypothetical protein
MPPFDPAQMGYVGHWGDSSGDVITTGEISLWSTTAANLTDGELAGAVERPAVIVDDDVNAVDATDNELDITTHAYQTGDGPLQLTTTGALPGGLALATDYWVIKRSSGAISLATSLENALKDVEIDITSAGSGTHTIVDTASTKRLHWDSIGLLGHAGDGAVSVDGSRSYRARFEHSPNVVAYALVGTTSAAISASVHAAAGS